jgi:hypothetical protein
MENNVYQPPGTVLKTVKAWSVDISDDPLYTVVVSDREGEIICGAEKYRHINDSGNFGATPTWDVSYTHDETDIAHAVVCPPEDWPDEVCRYMALRALLGSKEGE